MNVHKARTLARHAARIAHDKPYPPAKILARWICSNEWPGVIADIREAAKIKELRRRGHPSGTQPTPAWRVARMLLDRARIRRSWESRVPFQRQHRTA